MKKVKTQNNGRPNKTPVITNGDIFCVQCTDIKIPKFPTMPNYSN
jgi:hypothetical protein